MNVPLISLEAAVVVLGIVVLLVDLWLPARFRRGLGYVTAAALAGLFVWSYRQDISAVEFAFGGMYRMDGTAIFLKKLFLTAGFIVVLMSVEHAEHLETGLAEYLAISLFALAGMMLAASSHHLALLFVSVELVTLSFFILVSYHRRRLPSIEAGIKYLIQGAFSSGFMVYGIALIYGATGTMDFTELKAAAADRTASPVLNLGVLLLLSGLGFKVAVVPFQIWVADVYQGAPAPTTAFLAIGSKAAGIVLLLRLFCEVLTPLDGPWRKLLILMAMMSILYGTLCAIPQTNIKRLLGYSGIANAGYLMMGIALMSPLGAAAVLYYLVAYLFAILAAFTVIGLAYGPVAKAEISSLAGLSRRAPLLALALTLAMISLAGIPPLAGFMGKFFLLRSVLTEGHADPMIRVLLGIAIFGVALSIWYYFSVIRVMFWTEAPEDAPAPKAGPAGIVSLSFCILGMLYLGIAPGRPWQAAEQAVQSLQTYPEVPSAETALPSE